MDDEKIVYSKGCLDSVRSYRVEFSLGVAGSTAITSVFKIIAILLALYLSHTLKQQRGYGDV
ncbi:unnamed protein product [Callosobruchus maculatus]|uniref:Uncharacterized protein n=1 Tax=Callosobruchus maculatus TaxID=64391 RepID=A0A653DHT9_CALMS|nr:unnamed protein product [Callosobruchus maculatus]